jgi:hypothetical protein
MQPGSKESHQQDLNPRCHVSFSIIGSSLDFDEISATLNQESAQTGRAGSKSALGALTEDVWSIISPIGPLKPLTDHFRWLRSQIEPHIEYLGTLSGTARMRVYIGFTFSQEQNGFAISPEFVRLFASFNATIEMYIICNFGDDLEEAKGLAGGTTP